MRDEQEIERSAVRFLATLCQIQSFSCLTEPGGQQEFDQNPALKSIKEGLPTHSNSSDQFIEISKADKGSTSLRFSASDRM